MEIAVDEAAVESRVIAILDEAIKMVDLDVPGLTKNKYHGQGEVLPLAKGGHIFIVPGFDEEIHIKKEGTLISITRNYADTRSKIWKFVIRRTKDGNPINSKEISDGLLAALEIVLMKTAVQPIQERSTELLRKYTEQLTRRKEQRQGHHALNRAVCDLDANVVNTPTSPAEQKAMEAKEAIMPVRRPTKVIEIDI
jgi:hypothetical protein